MPMPNIPVPEFPDVPSLPGVPSLLRNPLEDPVRLATQVLTGDVLGILNDLLRPIWGIFDQSGRPMAVADTVATLEYRADSRISDYPQEKGAFASYNKVQVPYDARVQLVCGRNKDARSAFLASIEAAKQSTDLYTVVTPERTYANANVVAYDVRRETRDGATLLKVNVHLEEVRMTGVALFGNTQNPASADPASQGQVQTTATPIDMASITPSEVLL
ncbi:hypothetical protein Cmtc_08910 [Cupriavidus sp. TKC]|nr:hypothetical protein Cmtc_08910 [Cupriavidus sp. TKC]